MDYAWKRRNLTKLSKCSAMSTCLRASRAPAVVLLCERERLDNREAGVCFASCFLCLLLIVVPFGVASCQNNAMCRVVNVRRATIVPFEKRLVKFVQSLAKQ